jgi:ABC-2 type transport system ATP-binding protein
MTSGRNTAVQVRDLVKRYPTVTAVGGVSFDVQAGEIFGMVGPNGAGKTTAIECIEGFRHPDGGTIRVLGMDPLRDRYQVRERIGVQFQSAALPDRIKVWEALDLFSSFYAQSADWHSLMERMGLRGKRDAYFANLSGGQKQRLFIALSLVNNPDLVFLDELTTGLDPQARRGMWDLVRDIRDRGTTVFLTTHFMEEAERLCDRVLIIDRGEIVALDTPQCLIDPLGARYRVIFEAEEQLDERVLDQVPGVIRVERIGERVVVYGQEDGLVGGVVDVLEAGGIRFRNLHTEQPSLEDVFLALTGKEMRG